MPTLALCLLAGLSAPSMMHSVQCTSPGLPAGPITEEIRSKEKGVSWYKGHFLALLPGPGSRRVLWAPQCAMSSTAPTPSMAGPRHKLDTLPPSLQPTMREPAVQIRKRIQGRTGNEVWTRIMGSSKMHRPGRRCGFKAQGSNPSSSYNPGVRPCLSS